MLFQRFQNLFSKASAATDSPSAADVNRVYSDKVVSALEPPNP